MEPGEPSFDFFANDDDVVGDFPASPLDRPVAKQANRIVKGETSDNTYINLGELGEHQAKETRFRDSARQGFLTVYMRTRESVSEMETSTKIKIGTVALGVVVAGVYGLKHRKK